MTGERSPHSNRSTPRDGEPGIELTLDELCEAAGVTVRTVRYYISEGLLPPPTGHGTQARYGREHLDRLLVIARLKEQYLPLREIRRALERMTPRQLRDTAALVEPPLHTSADGVAALSPEPFRAKAVRSPSQHEMADEPAGWSSRQMREDASAARYIADTLAQSPAPHRRGVRSPAPASAEPTTWRRIPISDEAELMVTDQAWSRRREQLESLITWAQKILKGS